MALEFICEVCGGRLAIDRYGPPVPTREGYTCRTNCSACGKRFTIRLDMDMQEISRAETRKQKGNHTEVQRHHRPTICWKCQKACGGPNGCSWFNGFKPVPGWEAISNKMQYNGIQKGLTSYTVIKCPEFIADNRKAGA